MKCVKFSIPRIKILSQITWMPILLSKYVPTLLSQFLMWVLQICEAIQICYRRRQTKNTKEKSAKQQQSEPLLPHKEVKRRIT